MKWNTKIFAVSLCLLFCYSISLSCAAAKDLKRFDKGTKTCRVLRYDSFWGGKGRRLFDQKCKVCHTRDNTVNATFLYSESKSPKGWNRVFYAKYPHCAKTGEWNISQDEALLINDYLYRYANDTHDPNVAA